MVIGLSRREFISTVPAVMFGLGLGGVAATNDTNADVIVAKKDLPYFLVRAALRELGGISQYVKPGDLVAVKPNFSWDCLPNAATNAANTDPDVVRAVVELCLEAGASEVKVVDHTLTKPPEQGLRSSQIRGKLAKYGEVECKTLNDKPAEFTKVRISDTVGDMGFSKDVLNADIFINMPKVKNHNEAVATIALKNLMGLVDNRGQIHSKGLHKPIADLTSFLLQTQASSGQRYLVVADAIKALKSGGPGGPGKVIRPDCILAGTNPVDIDTYGCGLLGIEPSSVSHLRIASEEYGLGAGEGLKANVLDVSTMDKNELVPDILPTTDGSGFGRWSYLLPVGIAVAACIGVGYTYSRRSSKRSKAGRRRRRPRPEKDRQHRR